jgi:hypothetical protein
MGPETAATEIDTVTEFELGKEVMVNPAGKLQ